MVVGLIKLRKTTQMKQKICITLLCLVGLNLSAQNLQRATLGNSGSSTEINDSSENYYVSQSVGQSSIIGTFTNENHTIRQGFQQPPIRVLISPETNNDLDAIVYPNPVDTNITLQFNEEINNPINIVVYDISGKLILSKTQRPESSFNLDLSFLASGTYMLNITSGNKRFLARLIKK